MTKYYNRINTVLALIGLYHVLAGLFLIIPDMQLYASVPLLISVRLFAGKTKEERKEIQRERVAIMRQHKGFMYLSLFLHLVLPLAIGLVAFYIFGLSYNRAAFIFIGASCFLSVYVNWRMIPYHREQITQAFD